MADGSVIIEVKLDDGNVAKGIANVEGKFGRLRSTAGNVASGIAKIAGALGLVEIASKAIDIMTQSLDGAISRYDTLNNFPRVMEQIGFSTEEADNAINRLSDGIQGLPTTLDSVAGTAQRIAVMTGDLDGAVETTLALNNAFLASGASTEDAQRGLEQYVQMLAKGEVDLESWRTLQETMGVALNDVAKAFGFAGESAQNDLYDALKEGDITFSEFNEKLIELSNETDGFADRALTASGGIETAWQNVKTAIVSGLADVIGAIDEALGGTGSLESGINRLKDGVNSFFSAVSNAIPVVVGYIQDFKAKLEEWQPTIDRIKEAFSPFVSTIQGAFQDLIGSVGPIWESLKQLLTSLTPVLELVGAALLVALGIGISVFNGIISAIGPVIEAFVWLADMVVNVVLAIVAVLTGDFSGALEYWEQATESSVEFVKSLWEGIKNFFSTLIDSIIEFFAGLYETLVGNSIIPDMVNEILEWIGDLKDRFIELVMELVDSVIEFFVNLYNSAVENVTNMVQSVVDKFTEMKDNAVQKAQEILTNVTQKFEEVKTNIKNKITEAKDALVQRFSEMVSNAIQKAQEIASNVRQKFEEIKSNIKNKMEEAKAALVDKFSEMASNAREKATEMLSAVTEKFEAMKSAISDKLESAKETVQSALDSIKGFFDDLDLYESGKAIIQSAIDGISSMKDSIISTASDIVGGIRNLWPFSPAKEGPLSDIHRMDFAGPIGQSLDRAKRPLKGAASDLAEDVRGKLSTSAAIRNRLRGQSLPIDGILPSEYATQSIIKQQFASDRYDDTKVVQLLKQIAEKDGDIYIDGEKVTDVVNENNAIIASLNKF